MSDQFDREINAADVVDFLEKGLLESLVSLFKAEPSLYPLLTELLGDERIAVRLGTSALVESLAEEDPGASSRAVDALVPLLERDDPVVRGDAAWLLGRIGRSEALAPLRALEKDANSDVRETALEAVAAIERGGGSRS